MIIERERLDQEFQDLPEGVFMEIDIDHLIDEIKGGKMDIRWLARRITKKFNVEQMDEFVKELGVAIKAKNGN
jgi:hypothetical protein